MQASTFWDVTVPRAMTIFANTVFAALWIGLIVTLAANRQLPSKFWGLPRCGGYISDDPENDPYMKAAHLIVRSSI